MTATQPDSDRTISRRGLMRATAVGVGASATGAIGIGSDFGAVDRAEAALPLVAGAIGTAIAVDWALREFDVLGSDTPAEGLTADALKQDVYETARTRKSTNASTIVDNGNILDGVKNNAYTDAKISAIEELNAGSSESAVLDAANAAIDGYETTVKTNFLKTWNESTSELEALTSAISSHSEVTLPDVTYSPNWGGSQYIAQNPSYDVVSYDLPDGTSIDVQRVSYDWNEDGGTDGTTVQFSPVGTGGSNTGFEPFSEDSNYDTKYQFIWSIDGDSVAYMKAATSGSWGNILNEIDTKFQNVRDGINTWVTNVYSDVQSGEIEISELVTPRERAEMLSNDEGEAQAIADLAALNIPIDSEREATITITETNATLSGTLGLSDESDGPIEVGSTYDPSTLSGDVYLTADVSQITGGWTEYETGVDGGTITLAAEPYDGVTYDVTTAAGETVSIPSASWNATGSGIWTYDASGELETAITEVESIEYSSSASEAQVETLRLTRQFTVESITNRETGEEVTAASFESSEPQTDSNYITQDEWDQLEQQNQDLIEKYEESQNTGGAGAGFFGDRGPSIGAIAAGVGGLGVVYALFGQGEN